MYRRRTHSIEISNRNFGSAPCSVRHCSTRLSLSSKHRIITIIFHFSIPLRCFPKVFISLNMKYLVRFRTTATKKRIPLLPVFAFFARRRFASICVFRRRWCCCCYRRCWKVAFISTTLAHTNWHSILTIVLHSYGMPFMWFTDADNKLLHTWIRYSTTAILMPEQNKKTLNAAQRVRTKWKEKNG